MAAAMEARQQDGSLHPGGISDPEEVSVFQESYRAARRGSAAAPSENSNIFQPHCLQALLSHLSVP